MEVNEDDERRHADKFHSEVSFELGSKHQGRVMMIKQEPGSREGVGGDGGMYELIDFSEVDNDDIYVTPDEDPLSLDQVTRHHCNVVDRRKATVKTPRDVPKTQSGFRAEPAQNSMPVTTMGNGSEMRNEMEEIEAIIDESEMQLEAEVSDVKVKTEFIGMPSDVNNQESPNVSNNSKEVINTVRKEKRRTWLCTICNVGFPTEQLYIFHMKATHSDKFPHACRHCGKRFAKQNEKKKHETIHDPNRFKGEPKYACEFCDKRYHIKVSLEGHRKVTHLGYIKPNKRVSSAPVTQHHSKGIRKPEPEVKVEKVYPCTEMMKLKNICAFTREKRHTLVIFASNHLNILAVWVHILRMYRKSSKLVRRSHVLCLKTRGRNVFKLPSRLTKHMTLHTGEPGANVDSLPIPDNLNEEAVTVAQNVLAGFNEFPGSVNLNDRASIQSVLGGKTLRIILSHVTFKEAASRHEVNLSESEDDDGAKTITPKTVNIHDVASINSILGNKELRICLQKS
ncbi:Zinc finger Y-chromosomal protein 1 [Orchesella cincta]|uniref:Zinc finger Y-chromosomal protein 1 n=1 Tax=Orchesella cincta TaxID=48709 RepID=A0A1D2MB42_ORCCI|nr:Zinc finger Y-chromosomal protein 1 [Orchesella cincta]